MTFLRKALLSKQLREELFVVQKLLTPAMSPGQCFPLNGSTGYVDIQLHTPIAITGFSLEHIPSAIAYDITSAPNKVALEVLSAPETHKVKGGLFTPHKTHGPFRYNLKANSAVQTFSIFSESPEPASFVRLKVRLWQAQEKATVIFAVLFGTTNACKLVARGLVAMLWLLTLRLLVLHAAAVCASH